MQSMSILNRETLLQSILPSRMMENYSCCECLLYRNQYIIKIHIKGEYEKNVQKNIQATNIVGG